jgi:pyruvate formate-lyase/glycerol dehydratase family glycyl radical enzyme
MNAPIHDPALSGERIDRLKQSVESAPQSVCPERALLWTGYFRDRKNRKKPAPVRMAEALGHVLLNKSIAIYPDELLAGNYTSHRVGGNLYPELHSIQAMFEIGTFPTRRVNPMSISRADVRSLRRLIPFWLLHGILGKIYRNPFSTGAFLLRQLRPFYYIINELGGIVHFAPDYESLITEGTDGIAARAAARQVMTGKGSDEWNFLESVRIAADALARFGQRYADRAAALAAEEGDPRRKEELEAIARMCSRVPRLPARSFHEALQSMLLAQIAINQESLDLTICFGRIDQYLYRLYRQDCDAGVLDRDRAKELVACFMIKLCESVPVFSKLVTCFIGGMPSFQGMVVGGVGRDGKDAANELSYLFLEVMDSLRMRQPNFSARVHAAAPAEYLDAVYATIGRGGNFLAVYNDDVIVPTMVKQGVTLEDARDYSPIGCVEPTSQGRSLNSTDAVLFNMPIMVELAMNRGRRFGSLVREGVRTPGPSAMKTMAAVTAAFEKQLGHRIDILIRDLRRVELAHRRYKPTPLSSMLIEGCIEKARCSTNGGAKYNASGLQCVGQTAAGDSLYAVEKLVFTDRVITLDALVDALKRNLDDPAVRARLKGLSSFGNGDEEADRWTAYVIDRYVSALAAHGNNTRGGRYVAGLYSVTAHEYFGRVTGALPCGRMMREPFESGIAPMNGRDRKGTTALLNSMNSLDFSRCPNGINFNMKFQKDVVAGATGTGILKAYLGPYFERGGMQVQVNVLDRDTLIEARNHPERYPNLLVRVSGYATYFRDLSDEMKDEIIMRTENTA